MAPTGTIGPLRPGQRSSGGGSEAVGRTGSCSLKAMASRNASACWRQPSTLRCKAGLARRCDSTSARRAVSNWLST
jgi:hypothetical protein